MQDGGARGLRSLESQKSQTQRLNSNKTDVTRSDHPTAIPLFLAQGKIVFHETRSWRQKGWRPLVWGPLSSPSSRPL